MQLQIPNTSFLTEAARLFAQHIQERRILAFYGSMGAGKTTFIRSLCEVLGVKDTVTSPSFAIINEYALPKTHECIYHFDFYRIRNLNEVYDLGYEDYFYSGQLCLIEWPELIEELLPKETMRIRIQVHPDDSRTLFWD
ncbi:MAG: tRNA (adenosine(37)-N6)-threonylcarbamoyltransferase complex ATPase subunit type 1 TsaE [Bacteroidaceae bacterium]|nr:tRNA (adenosine(37)-N6)-threonylcarbamoyltransferase complex ATPase subunit type 1 TsaE [Bacteroidaceae bacterium]